MIHVFTEKERKLKIILAGAELDPGHGGPEEEEEEELQEQREFVLDLQCSFVEMK